MQTLRNDPTEHRYHPGTLARFQLPEISKWLTIRRKLFLGAMVPVPIMIVSSLLAYEALRHSTQVQEDVTRSERIISQVGSLLRYVVDAETAERGFLLTSDERFLAPYHSAIQEYPATIRNLNGELQHSPTQLKRLADADLTFENWKQVVAIPITEHRRAAPLQVVALAQSTSALWTRLGDNLGTASRSRTDPQTADAAAQSTLSQMGALLREHPNLPHANQLKDVLDAVEEYRQSLRQGPDTQRSQQLQKATKAVESWAGIVLRHEQAALDIVRSGLGRKMVEEIRGILNSLIREEAQAQSERVKNLQEELGRARQGMLGAILVALVLSLLYGLFMSRGVSRSTTDLVNVAQGVASGDLTLRSTIQSQDELGRLSNAFNQMATRLQKRQQETELTRQLGEMLQSAHSADEAFEIIGRFARWMFPSLEGHVLFMNSSRNALQTGASWDSGMGEVVPESFEPSDCWGIRGGRIHVYSPASGVPCRHLKEAPFTASICVPISNSGETIGLLHLKTGASPSTTSDVFISDELRLANVLAEQVSLALGNLRLREKLRNQAIRDPLTGLFNRRYLEETLDRELERCRRANTPLTLMLLDVDHFKRFNDTQGHDAGDALLSQMGALMSQCFRTSDIPCRFGGEEFVVVLPEAPLSVGEVRANQFREAVKELSLMHNGRHLGTVTISVGVAEFPSHGATSESLLKVADVALYEAKRNGRDQVRGPAASGTASAVAPKPALPPTAYEKV